MVHRILVHGHRGARATRPENTLAAFAYAIEAGADAIELDVAVTRDDVPVVSHDPSLADAVIRELSLAEVKRAEASIPTLAEVCELAANAGVVIDVELKSFPEWPEYSPTPEEFARLVLDELRRYRLEGRAIVQSFDFRVLRAFEGMAPEVPRAALTESDGRDFAAIAREAGHAGIVAPHYELVTAGKVRGAHDAGLQVIPWTVNEPEDWARMALARVDAIITDDPAGLIAWLRARDPEGGEGE